MGKTCRSKDFQNSGVWNTLISITNGPLNFNMASDVLPSPHHVNRKKCQSKMAPHQPTRKVGPVIKNPSQFFPACGSKNKKWSFCLIG